MPSVLLVEDDAGIARLVQLALSPEAIECRHARNARDGLASLRESQPGLVILDFTLPDMDGLGFLAAARDAGYSGPVLFLTALGRDDPLVEQLGAMEGAAVLLKPFDPDELVGRVRSALAV